MKKQWRGGDGSDSPYPHVRSTHHKKHPFAEKLDVLYMERITWVDNKSAKFTSIYRESGKSL